MVQIEKFISYKNLSKNNEILNKEMTSSASNTGEQEKLIRFYDDDPNNFIGSKDKLNNLVEFFPVGQNPYQIIVEHNETGLTISQPINKNYYFAYKYFNLNNWRRSQDTISTFIKTIFDKEYNDNYFETLIKKNPSQRIDKQKLKNQYFNEFVKLDTFSLATTGISVDQIVNLINWSKTNGDEKKVYFDWDQTLSVLPGFVHEFHTHLETYLTYMLGGPVRFQFLKKLFSTLHDNKVEIFILTNNRCEKTIFMLLIKELDPNFKEKNLLFGRNAIQFKSLKISYIQHQLGLIRS